MPQVVLELIELVEDDNRCSALRIKFMTLVENLFYIRFAPPESL